MFAGKECARALALMSTDATDCRADVSDLPADKHTVLRDWQRKFMGKYKVVGALQGAAWDTGLVNQANAEVAAREEAQVQPKGHNTPLIIASVAVAVAGVACAIALMAATNS